MSATLLYIKTTSQRKREKVSLANHVTFAHGLFGIQKKKPLNLICLINKWEILLCRKPETIEIYNKISQHRART